ncbi:MAG: vWA domain-containing protein [Pseudomonadota bacterium]
MMAKINAPSVALALAIALLIVSLWQPTALLPSTTYRYVYIFDISQSMNATDVDLSNPKLSRLEQAKSVARESLNALPCGSEVGVGLFTGHRAFLLLTPVEICANVLELDGIIDNVNWQMTWKLRSEIAKGVHKSIKLLTQMSDPTRLVFFTDGHEAPPLHPDLAPKLPDEAKTVPGIIAGVGGAELVPIPKFDKNGEQDGVWGIDEVMHVDAFTASQNAREGTENAATGTEHLSSLKGSYLQSLADDTGLLYRQVITAQSFSSDLKHPSLGIPRVDPVNFAWILGLFALALTVTAHLFALPARAKS